MVYILELKTTQASAIKTVIDAINSLLPDANFDFYPYYIEDDDNSDDSDDSSTNETDEMSDKYESDSADDSSDEENEVVVKTNPIKAQSPPVEKKKNIGGVVLKEVNKTGKILVYMRLDADKFDVYKYNYNKKKINPRY